MVFIHGGIDIGIHPIQCRLYSGKPHHQRETRKILIPHRRKQRFQRRRTSPSPNLKTPRRRRRSKTTVRSKRPRTHQKKTLLLKRLPRKKLKLTINPKPTPPKIKTISFLSLRTKKTWTESQRMTTTTMRRMESLDGSTVSRLRPRGKMIHRPSKRLTKLKGVRRSPSRRASRRNAEEAGVEQGVEVISKVGVVVGAEASNDLRCELLTKASLVQSF